jgi:2EXR family
MIWKEGSRSPKEYLPIKDADNFLHFPELAQEVQIKIWEHVCEIPRVVELGSAPLGSKKRRQDGLYPAALETCFLSRQIGLQ